MPEPILCRECGAPVHGMYQDNRWQIRHDVMDMATDGTTTHSTLFAAVACSAKCAATILIDEATDA